MTTGQPRLSRRAVLGGLATALAGGPATGQSTPAPDLVLHNGRIATLDRARPRVAAAAVRGGEILALGEDRDVVPLAGPETRVVDLRGRAAIPGLNDSHTHPIRGGLHYNMELRWDGVRSLADGMRMLREQVAREPRRVLVEIACRTGLQEAVEPLPNRRAMTHR